MGDNFAFLLPLVLALFGAAFLIVARFGNRASRFWGAGYLCAAAGFLVPGLGALLPIKLVALCADALFLAAFFLYSHAVVTHYEAVPRTRLRLALVCIAYTAIAYAVVVAESLRMELLVSDLACGLLLITALVAARHRVFRPIDIVLFTAVIFVVLETVVRSLVYFVVAGTPAIEAFITSSYAYVMQITATIGALLLALTALAAVTLRLVDHHRRAAEEDPLTGLHNRRGFERHVSLLAGERRGGALIVADIDHFKAINDRHGHAAGDEVIREVGRLLSAIPWPDIVVARFGGEEFVAYLPGARLEDAHVLANTARLNLAGQDWSRYGMDLPVTASFGVDVTAASDHTIHDAISRADRALYRAKNDGRNRVDSGFPSTLPEVRAARIFDGSKRIL